MAAHRPNRSPHASLTMDRDGRTVTMDGRSSSDPDGSVVSYIWEFDDGTILEGPVVSHRYTEPGSYMVTLTVVDDEGAVDGAVSTTPVEVSRYDFSGLFAPVDMPPVVNRTNAGQAVPVKFSLGGDEGLDIFESDSPRSQRVDCVSGSPVDDVEQTVTPGESALRYDAGSGRYHYVWKTSKTWGGQCRDLTLAFDDGSSVTARFQFR